MINSENLFNTRMIQVKLKFLTEVQGWVSIDCSCNGLTQVDNGVHPFVISISS